MIMKLSNIFKKETKTAVKANVEKLEKNQLSKVIGGTDGAIDGDSTTADNVLKTKHDTVKNSINNVR